MGKLVGCLLLMAAAGMIFVPRPGAAQSCTSSPPNCCSCAQTTQSQCVTGYNSGCGSCGTEGCTAQCQSTGCNTNSGDCVTIGGTVSFCISSILPCGGIPGCCVP
jgi:hypothetical protein